MKDFKYKILYSLFFFLGFSSKALGNNVVYCFGNISLEGHSPTHLLCKISGVPVRGGAWPTLLRGLMFCDNFEGIQWDKFKQISGFSAHLCPGTDFRVQMNIVACLCDFNDFSSQIIEQIKRGSHVVSSS